MIASEGFPPVLIRLKADVQLVVVVMGVCGGECLCGREGRKQGGDRVGVGDGGDGWGEGGWGLVERAKKGRVETAPYVDGRKRQA